MGTNSTGRNPGSDVFVAAGVPGSSPGTFAPGETCEITKIRAFAWQSETDLLIEEEGPNLERIAELRENHDHLYLDVRGTGSIPLLESLTEAFSIHPLVLEDCLHGGQRAKIEEYDDFVFIVAWMMQDTGVIERAQINLILGRGWLISIQSSDHPALDPVRDRLRHGRRRMRSYGIDYMAYALLDSVIDHYMPVLERQGDAVEELEDQLVAGRRLPRIEVFHEMKRNFLHIRRSIWPLRESVNLLIRDGSEFFSDETLTFLRDAHDHTIQVIEITEIYRELSASLMELHVSMVGARMNEVMKVLTIIATIFIPATFVSSIYGMNFDSTASPWNMPELHWAMGYPFAMALMACSMLLCLAYFWRKGWLSSGQR